MRRNSLLLALLLVASSASAQTAEPTPYQRAIAAGYKALTLCSAIFNAGRTQEQAEALELTGIYPEYDAIVPTLMANVNRETATVAVPFDGKLAARRAAWRPDFGCTIYPIGAGGPVVGTDYGKSFNYLKPADERAWPTGDRNAFSARQTTPALAATVTTAFNADGRTTAILVVRGDRIVAEKYLEGFGVHTSQRTWSVAKSIAGTLIGVAARQKLLDINRPTSIPEWSGVDDPRGRIALDAFLRMASGLHSDHAGNRTDAVYFGGTGVTEQTTGLPLEVMPGTRFRYSNNDILLAIRSLRAILERPPLTYLTRDRYAAFPKRELFDKIGMAHTVAETDWQGNFILSSQVWSTARDLARFGMLYLQDGVWNGERILPEGWVRYVTTPSGPQPSDGEFGYGATFWLMNKSPGVPADTFAAFGNRGQYVVIVPSRNVVIVRRGEDPAGARFDIARFTADVLAALR